MAKIKPRILVIELGIKKVEQLKKYLKFSNSEVIFASSFMNIVDILHLEDVNIILISDFRGKKSTTGYIKILKIRDPNYKVIIISINKFIQITLNEFYKHHGANEVFSFTETKSLKQHLKKLSIKISNDEKLKNRMWTNCTNKVIRFIKDNYHIKDNIINLVSDKLKYSKSTLFHYIKNDTGKTIGTWIQELRINGSINLLKSTNMGIGDISNCVGYKSTIGFIKAFKTITGKTPSLYRKESFL